MFIWMGERGTNFLDSGAPFYDTYETKDGKFVAVGALEPQFFKNLVQGIVVPYLGLCILALKMLLRLDGLHAVNPRIFPLLQ